ncbi:MAG: hypothetical protein PSX80_07165 [bacterium]|nr:hypothetical protein [bacterium]
MRKVILISYLAITLLGVTSCQSQVLETWDESAGPAERTHLVVLFNEGASEDEIRTFSSMVLGGDNNTYRVGVYFRIQKTNRQGLGINFLSSATDTQKKELIEKIEQSKIFYKLYENVIPNEIPDS